MKSRAVTLLVLLACSLAAVAKADCPDAGIRCRIPIANVGSSGTENGCSVTGDAKATITGEIPSATLSVGGTCYQKVTTSDKATYLVVGTISIGQCYNLFQGGCQPDHCNNNVPSDRCNKGDKALPDCTVYKSAATKCSKTYTVKSGDSCSAIATANGLTLQALQDLNKGVSCGTGLQVNQNLCLAQTLDKGPGTPVCEGFKISG
jgi:LysM repeat protein